VSDGALSDAETFTWTIRAANVAPVLTNPGTQTSDAGQSLVLQQQATDANGDALTYSATGLPTGLQVTASTGRISGTPTTAGTYNVTASVSDGTLSDAETFTWTIRAANVAPVLTNPGTRTSDAGQALVLQLQATDANGDTLTYAATGLPTGLQVTSSTGRISGTPTTTGTFTVTATVSDGSLSDAETFAWTIRQVNRAPRLTNPGAQRSSIGAAVALQLQGSDPDGDPLTFGALGLPPGLSVTPSTGRIAGTPTTAGTFTVAASVSDGAFSVSEFFTWTIETTNAGPTLANPGDQAGDVGVAVVLQLQGADPNGDALTYAASSLPPGLQLTPATGRIAGTPTSPGTYAVVASVSDGALSASQSFTWTVRAVNRAPVVTNPGDQQSDVNGPVVLQIQASDPEGAPLTFSATGLPPGLQIAASTGRISGTPVTAGLYAVQVSVADGSLAAAASFTWTIREIVPENGAPSLTAVASQRTDVGHSVALQLTASDPDGDPLTFTAVNLPAGLQIAASTGLIQGAPTNAGTYTVTVSVSDGQLSASRGFTWVVTAINSAPSLTGPGDQTNLVGDGVVLALQASDPDGDTLSFTASGLPMGLQVNASTGRISGTPSVAGSFSVSATVSDGALTATRSFSWTVVAANVAPTLASVLDQTGTVGSALTLQLQGADANGDALTYHAAGLPPGLQITAGSGIISGVPTTAGTYSVSATVSDGRLSASRAFVWVVSPENVAPRLSNPGDQTNLVGDSVALTLDADDPLGEPLTFSSAGLPPGLSLSPTSGRVAGSPSSKGTYSVTVRASNGRLSAEQTFTWLVREQSGSRKRSDGATNSGKSATPRKPKQETTTTTATYTGTTAVTRDQTETSVTAEDTTTYTGTTAATRSTASQPTSTRQARVYSGGGGMPAPAPITSASLSTSTPPDASAADDGSLQPQVPLLQTEVTSVNVIPVHSLQGSAPTLRIDTPVDTARFSSGADVIFSAAAHDVEDGDLSSRIVWSSSRDGWLGTGGLLHRVLSDGAHVITATVTDGDGRTRSGQLTVIVGGAPID
jgi:hypothetical protein